MSLKYKVVKDFWKNCLQPFKDKNLELYKACWDRYGHPEPKAFRVLQRQYGRYKAAVNKNSKIKESRKEKVLVEQDNLRRFDELYPELKSLFS